MPFFGPVIPYGAMVECHTYRGYISLAQKSCQFFFFGYVLYAGGIRKGDFMVADIAELEEMDASEIHARRLNAKEVSTPQRIGFLIFHSQLEQSHPRWKSTSIHFYQGSF